jgi:hypothetical protein
VTISLTGYFALSSSQLAMPQRVILSLGNGSLQEGFRSVQARFRQDAITQMQVAGSLPPAPELKQGSPGIPVVKPTSSVLGCPRTME